ncbi:gliding motility-associated C-terminal domain-containing protein [Flavobacterium sp.]|uniref:T9SS type B sorting domain-containing protein n=1 Tax=Flavobacterium sp. TaxID=239 RepID=UPI0039E639B2
MKQKTSTLLAAFLLLWQLAAWSQCTEIGCNGNAGLYSNDNAADIEYDNMGSGFHATYIQQPDALWKVWGEDMDSGWSFYSPAFIDNTNYPQLTGTVYKVGIGGAQQMIVLTSTGLFAIGGPGVVVDYQIADTYFKKLTVAGKTDGLPAGVSPEQVKMLFVTSETIIITSCSGNVYVLSMNGPDVRGNGGNGSATQWSQVMTAPNEPLTDIIVARGNVSVGYALKSDGTLWTWGRSVYFGDGTPPQNRNYATQMVLPEGLPGIKMIVSTNIYSANTSYYILGTDRKVYGLGRNMFAQLGDNSTFERFSWVKAMTLDWNEVTDATWISANEHFDGAPGLAIIRQNGQLLTAGNNDRYMLGLDNEFDANYLKIPNGILPTDVITQVEVGGHSTAVVKLGSPRYGYVGHRIEGSMGDGSFNEATQQTFDFITPPIVYICGSVCAPPTLTVQTPICAGENAVFTINAAAGDQITYAINDGAQQTVTVGSNGSVVVSVNNANADQQIELTHILGVGGNCSNPLSISESIEVLPITSPTFEPLPGICRGESFGLPLVSLEGITGHWQPVENNMQTTLYTFYPDGSCGRQATMQVGVYDAFDFDINKFCNAGQLFLQPVPIANGFDPQTASYDWQYANNQVSTSNVFNVTAFQQSNAQAALPLSFSVTVTTADGCSRDHDIVLENTYCDIQRGVSPNGDGSNDFFDLRLMQASGIKIFNRYGVQVYGKSDYTNQWVGQTDDGKELPTGVYYYVIDFKNEATKTGWVYLNK